MPGLTDRLTKSGALFFRQGFTPNYSRYCFSRRSIGTVNRKILSCFPGKLNADLKLSVILEPSYAKEKFRKDQLLLWRNNLQQVPGFEKEPIMTQTIGKLTLMAEEIKHLSLIVDGNRRWAITNGLPILKGHEKGYEQVLPKIIEGVLKFGVHTFSIWVLSNYNLLRDKAEILDSGFPTTLSLLNKSLAIAKFYEARIFRKGSDVCLNDDEDIRDAFLKTLEVYQNLEAQTESFKKHHLIFCSNYVGEDDLLRAFRRMTLNKVDPFTLTSKDLFSYTDLGSHPYSSPDLLIRTSSKQQGSRIGNFLPNMAETRLCFLEKLFPDFTMEDIFESSAAFAHPDNRYKSSNITYESIKKVTNKPKI